MFDSGRNPALLTLAFVAFSACSAPTDPARDPDASRNDVDVSVDDSAEPDNPSDSDTPDTAPDLPEVVYTSEFVVATWNVARFFDTVCDTGNCGQGDYEEQPSAAQFRVKLNSVVDALTILDADIVLLQEVESAECLDAIVEAFDGRYNVAIMGETGGNASLDVATLARGELVEVIRHANGSIPRPGGGTTSFAREFLEVRLVVEGVDVSVFNAHFKSQSNDDPSRRLAEARAAHAIVTSRLTETTDALVLLGGDLNDVPGSEPMNALLDDGQLLRVAEDLGGLDGTVEFDGERSALDHLLVGRNTDAEYVDGTAEVVRDRSPGFRGSDHSPLRAAFGVPTTGQQ